ncbi:MAG: xanthine dehydrogenase family protein subunit M [Acidimicrobiia bacterium]|nr:xanthine dehydrogenase family protein subunit M [Acidimicrobiia bacterium]NNL27935.1 xanthine dehydrogenase family protein subunit M [Acidimicrobiia bacterium]
MYPAAFAYSAPETLDEALATLSQEGESARVLAGGQSLIPMMKLRLASPAHLVDINNISGLDHINSANGYLRIGALVRHNDIVNSADIAAHNGAIASAAPWVADPLVRNRGTLCGSVAHCDPEGDWNSVMLAVRAEVVAQSAAGERVIPIDDFVVDFFTNSLEPGEIVTEVRIPKYTGKGGGAYLKLERKIGDYATVAVATQLQLGDDGKISEAGVALTAVNNKNTRATAAEQALVGQEPSDELFKEAGALAARAAEPESNVRGTAEWKRNVVSVYTRRGLEASLAQARA